MSEIKTGKKTGGLRPGLEVEGEDKVGGAKAKKAKAKKGNLQIQPGLREITRAEIAKLGGANVKERPIRVRFAPSPTGDLHIGSARTAIMNYLFARKMGATFVLRIEDTDPARSKPEFTEGILNSMKMLGMNWDEEPVYQSRRTELYNAKIDQLIKEGKAYVEPQSKAVFFKMPPEPIINVPDRVMGNRAINVSKADGSNDFVIRRSDGMPTFLFANCVDDGDQRITHILRGVDHLNNAAKQIPLFRALGYEVPEFYHMPLVYGDAEFDPETNQVKTAGKLSKRHGAVWVGEYLQQGYSPLVLMNHLARMGMTYDVDATVPIEELAKMFDPTRMSKNKSRLGVDTLNKRMMLQIKKLPLKELVAIVKDRLFDEDKLKAHVEDPGSEQRPGFFQRSAVTADEARQIVKNLTDPVLEAVADGMRARASNFGDILDTLFFFRSQPVWDKAEAKAYASAPMKKLMGKLKEQLERVPDKDWTFEKLEDQLLAFNAGQRVKFDAYGESLRWMLSGEAKGLPLHHELAVIGRAEVLARLQKMTAE